MRHVPVTTGNLRNLATARVVAVHVDKRPHALTDTCRLDVGAIHDALDRYTLGNKAVHLELHGSAVRETAPIGKLAPAVRPAGVFLHPDLVCLTVVVVATSQETLRKSLPGSVCRP